MRLSNDAYYLSLLEGVAARSTCVRRRVGAILVDDHARVLSMGFNGVPRGYPHCTDDPCPGANDPSGITDNCMAVHAELNAMLTCSRLEAAHTLYVSTSPCLRCALAICNTRVQRVVYLTQYTDTRGIEAMHMCGILVEEGHSKTEICT